MSTIGPMIADSARLAIGYSQRLLSDVKPDQFARLAVVNDTLIDANHGAFNYGHLSLYASRVVTELGGDASSIVASDKFNEVFSKDAKCVDDPDATIYPAMDEITTAYFAAYELAIETLLAASDDAFMQPNPNAAMREKFATIGSMHNFYVGGHIMMHLGQMSTWRRAMGFGPA